VLDILEQEGADLRHTVLCHMNPSFADKRYQRELVQEDVLRQQNLLDVAVVNQLADRAGVLLVGGRLRLRRHGVSGEQLETLMIGNPQRVFGG
jgi:phosphotriesterase-related protein